MISSWFLLAFLLGGVERTALPALPALAGAKAPAFVVIVNADNPATTIDREQLSQIFLKRVTTWPDGRAAEPVDLWVNLISRVVFTKAVHGTSVDAVRAFWRRQIFSGRDLPPPEKTSDREVVEFVARHSGAVGYVSASAKLIEGVKPIAIEGIIP